MTPETIQKIERWASQYETVRFIDNDPIRVPHRYTDKRDIEISAFVTAWLAWGRRDQIIKTAQYIDKYIFEGAPYDYVMWGKWNRLVNDWSCLYRTFQYSDFADICCTLRSIYLTFDSMEDWLLKTAQPDFEYILGHILTVFDRIKGIPRVHTASACKRLCLFLRWMVRQGPVDLEMWDILSPKQLIIPLDTHVMAMSTWLDLFPKNGRSRNMSAPTFRMAKDLTDVLRQIFPEDPLWGDFALFGAGIDWKNICHEPINK